MTALNPQTASEFFEDILRRLRALETDANEHAGDNFQTFVQVRNHDHPQYILVSLFDSIGDLLVGIGDNQAAILTIGPDGYALVSDSGDPFGMSWQPTGGVHDQAEAEDLAEVAAAAAAGSNPEIPYADHVHPHGSGYLPDAHHDEVHAGTHAADGSDPFTVKYESGAGATISDADYASTPPNGTLAVAHDTTSGKSYLYLRANGTWKAVEAT